MPSVVLVSPVYGTLHVGSGTIPGTYCERFKARFGPSNIYHAVVYGEGQSKTYQSPKEVKRELESVFQIHSFCKTRSSLGFTRSWYDYLGLLDHTIL
jgi:hypothetical protein